MDAPRLVEFTDELEGVQGTVSVPRFGFESGFRLKEVLSELGAEVAFTPEADFSGIAEGSEDLYIYDVYHDTFIEVDEEGTEAAASTGVVIGGVSATVGQFEMSVDRPFVFFIRDRRTKTVLFLGRVVSP
jgi:serpin B